MSGSSGPQSGPQSSLSRTVVHHTALAGRVKHTNIQYETGVVGEEGRGRWGERGRRGEKDGGRGEGGERRMEGEGLLTQQASPVESVGPTSKRQRSIVATNLSSVLHYIASQHLLSGSHVLRHSDPLENLFSFPWQPPYINLSHWPEVEL